MVRRVGIIGFGQLGKYLSNKIEEDEKFELAFVWNRTKDVLTSSFSPEKILNDLDGFESKTPDIVIEVAHPSITRSHGKKVLQYCDYMIGSPTALSDDELYQTLLNSSTKHGLYVPSGAFWGGEDIRKMSDAGKLKSLKVTMRKHPLSLKLEGHLKDKNALVQSEPVILYEGSVRGLCSLAPKNTNTMAAAALAAPCLGFDHVLGRLISDPNLKNYHIVDVEVHGFPDEKGSAFEVVTLRRNPAELGAVTGSATCDTFFESLKRAVGRGPGLHLC